MKKWIIFSGLIAVLVFTAVIAGCSKKSEEDFKIGCVASLSGEFSPWGEPAKLAYELAVKEINDAGGILGKKIELYVEDAETNPDTAVLKSRKLIEQSGVSVIVGVEGSNLRNAVMAVTEPNKTILLYPTNYEGGVVGKYLFNFGMVPSLELNDDMMKTLISEAKGKKLFHVGSDYEYPQLVNNYLEKTIVPKFGLEFVGKELVPLSQTEFSGTIKRISDVQPDILINNLIGPQSVSFQKQAYAYGLTDKMVMAGAGYLEISVSAMKQEGNGAYRTLNWVDGIDTEASKKFAADYKKLHGENAMLVYTSESAYNSIYALKAAIEKANSFNPDEIAKAMVSIKINGPSGPIEVTEDHHVKIPIFLTRAKDGKLMPVKELGIYAPIKDSKGLPF